MLVSLFLVGILAEGDVSFSSFGIWTIPEPSFLLFSHKFCSLDDSVRVWFHKHLNEMCLFSFRNLYFKQCTFVFRRVQGDNSRPRQKIFMFRVSAKRVALFSKTVGNNIWRWERNSINLDNSMYLFIYLAFDEQFWSKDCLLIRRIFFNTYFMFLLDL